MSTRRPRRIAFLLSQLGADASAAFDDALASLGMMASEADEAGPWLAARYVGKPFPIRACGPTTTPSLLW